MREAEKGGRLVSPSTRQRNKRLMCEMYDRVGKGYQKRKGATSVYKEDGWRRVLLRDFAIVSPSEVRIKEKIAGEQGTAV